MNELNVLGGYMSELCVLGGYMNEQYVLGVIRVNLCPWGLYEWAISISCLYVLRGLYE